MQAEIERLYRAISQDSRYGHYARIPERICRCLDYFNITHSRNAVKERLHSYYLFIGVVDDAIDSSQLEAGREILKQLENRSPLFDEEIRQSTSKLVTEILKHHINLEIYPAVLLKLEELYWAVVRERKSETIAAYIEQRRNIGCLTAELSYMLIQPLLSSERKDLCIFLEKVGEVGCLVDSVIDLREDERQGLLSFKPTLKDFLKLTHRMLHEGLRVTLKHPRLLSLFLEAATDDLFDRLWARGESSGPEQLDNTKTGYAFERAV